MSVFKRPLEILREWTEKDDGTLEGPALSTDSVSVTNNVSASDFSSSTQSSPYLENGDRKRYYFDSGNFGIVNTNDQFRARFSPEDVFGTVVITMTATMGANSSNRSMSEKTFAAQIRSDEFGPNETINTTIEAGQFGANDVTWTHTGSNGQFDMLMKNNTTENASFWAVEIEIIHSRVDVPISLESTAVEDQ